MKTKLTENEVEARRRNNQLGREPEASPREASNDLDTPQPTPSAYVRRRLPMTKDQIREATALVQALLPSVSGERLCKTELRLKFGWTAKRSQKLIDRVLQIWQREDAKSIGMTKGKARRRLEEHIRRAKPGSMAAIQAEAQLAKIEGTEVAPTIKIDVSVGQAAGAVLASLDIARMQQMVEEYDKTKQLASVALKQLSAPIPDAIICEDEPSQTTPPASAPKNK